MIEIKFGTTKKKNEVAISLSDIYDTVIEDNLRVCLTGAPVHLLRFSLFIVLGNVFILSPNSKKNKKSSQ